MASPDVPLPGLPSGLLDFLRQRTSYPHSPRSLRIVETHGSVVVLVPPFVYKVRKPVNFGFLNYSSLARRRYFCAREITLNRRLSDRVHIGLVPILHGPNGWTFGPVLTDPPFVSRSSAVREYAVFMRQLDERFFLKTLVKKNRVGHRELARVVAKLSRFYRTQTPSGSIARWGRIDRLKINTGENFRQTRKFLGRTLPRVADEVIRIFTREFYRAQKQLLQRRVAHGRILDCHGDLHLEHIHLTPQRVNIYDCIEFNDRLRYQDVASDIAFLAMDLDFNGRPDLAHLFEGLMAKALQDPELHLLLNFYKCYRAFVRGKVESIQSQLAHIPPTARRRHATTAGRYFVLARRYATGGLRPLIIVCMGRIASGKSTVAAGLARELSCAVVSSDRVRKELAGVPLRRRGSPRQRRFLYGSSMTERTYAELIRQAARAAKQGHDLVLDATFSRKRYRTLLRRRLGRRARVRFVELRAAPDTVRQRLRRRARMPGISDAREADLAVLWNRYEAPTELSPGELVQIRAGAPPAETTRRALAGLACLCARG